MIVTEQVARIIGCGVLVAAVVAAFPPTALAQEEDEPGCRIFCTPDFKLETAFAIEPLGRRPRIETLDADGRATGPPEREATGVAPEVVLAIGIPTELERVGFTIETILTPTGDTDANPFTGATGAFRDNGIEFEVELNLDWLTGDQTGGWVESHFDIVDKFSPAERPSDRSVYTHKLNFELDTAFLLFNWLPDGNWLKGVELEGSLDYIATGLPRAGDVIGGERFLDDASPWGFTILAVFPMAPLAP